MHDHEWDPRSSSGREGSERARPAKIEVLLHPRVDHFSSFLKGAGLYAQDVTSSDARIEKHRLITERWTT